MIESMAAKLATAGFKDLNLKPDHLLLSLDPQQRLVLNEIGKPELHICNLELVRKRISQTDQAAQSVF
ncbi:MAG: hypothetical protein RMH97_10050 [Verrucomicrobiales bacterium]|nr:hypothetical protein [Verrucomicrobiales bacterium]